MVTEEEWSIWGVGVTIFDENEDIEATAVETGEAGKDVQEVDGEGVSADGERHKGAEGATTSEAMTKAERERIVDDTAARLSEHFDAVQILVSWLDEKGVTWCTKMGRGLWHARKGMCGEFIETSKAEDIGSAVAFKMKDEEDEE